MTPDLVDVRQMAEAGAKRNYEFRDFLKHCAKHSGLAGEQLPLGLPLGRNIEDDQIRLSELGNDRGGAVRAGNH